MLKQNITRKHSFRSIYVIIPAVLLAAAAIGYFTLSGRIHWREIFASRVQGTPDYAAQIRFDASEAPVFTVCGSGVFAVDRTGLRLYSPSGKEEWKQELALNNPIIDVSGNWTIVSEYGGKGISVFSGRNLAWTSQIDGEIMGVSINPSGWATAVFSQKGYRAVVRIFKPDGGQAFASYFVSTYVISAEVSPDNKKVAVAELDTSGIQTASGIKFISMNGEVLSGIREENCMIGSMRYINNDTVTAVTDTSIILAGSTGTRKIISDFKGEKIEAVTTDADEYAVKAVKISSGVFTTESRLDILTRDGGKKAEYSLKGIVNDMDASDKIIAVNLGSEVHFVTPTGRLKKIYDPTSEVRGIRLLGNTSFAAALFGDRIEIIKY